MIERLMDMDIYKRDPLTNKYNSNVITKLIQNYRSHPAIIQLSNQMFYDNELVPSAQKGNNFFFFIISHKFNETRFRNYGFMFGLEIVTSK